MARRTTRRDFLKQGALAGAGFWAAGGVVIGDEAKKLANDKINVASIGVGGKGESDTRQAANLGNLVAICDIDDNRVGNMAKSFPKAEKFSDFRKMFEKMEKGIDAVTVSTADHTHAIASITAMKLKKHVYCQKPLTHTVYEARQMREIAAKMGVATQMGNQGSAADGLRRAVEFVQGGGIGAVKEAHVWTNRPTGFWKQAPDVTKRPSPGQCPAHVHFDEFLGPAPERPYSPGYHPFAWRGFWDFGTGALGDMACHTANMAFRALNLKYPTTIQAENGELNPETYPAWARITFHFPARGDMPPVKFVWYEGTTPDGKKVLPSPELVKGQGKRDKGNSIFFDNGKWFFSGGKDPKNVTSGSFLVGEKATLFSPNDYGAESYIVTADGVDKLTGKPEKLPSNNGDDQGMKNEWGVAIRGGKPAYSNFDFAAMLTETILLGNVAMRAGGRLLEWNGPELKITNVPEANAFLHYEYRKGWTL
jgi:predicted dehydrogenase